MDAPLARPYICSTPSHKAGSAVAPATHRPNPPGGLMRLGVSFNYEGFCLHSLPCIYFTWIHALRQCFLNLFYIFFNQIHSFNVSLIKQRE